VSLADIKAILEILEEFCRGNRNYAPKRALLDTKVYKTIDKDLKCCTVITMKTVALDYQ